GPARRPGLVQAFPGCGPAGLRGTVQESGQRRRNAPGAGGQQPKGLPGTAGEGTQGGGRQRNVAGRHRRPFPPAGKGGQGITVARSKADPIVGSQIASCCTGGYTIPETVSTVWQ